MDNPLSGQTQATIAAPTNAAERTQFWIDRGNRVLWGQEPCVGKKNPGQYLEPRTDLEWVCVNGSYSIQPRR